MFIVINNLISQLNNLWTSLKNTSKIDLQHSYKNNVGSYKSKLFTDKLSKYKYILYIYIFITMTFCPWLDNLFNNWYDLEIYNFYIMLLILFTLNFFLNMIMFIPAKNTLNFKLFFLKLKSFYFYLNSFLVKLNKIYIFFKNEILFKSFFFNFIKLNLIKFSNYFTYWRPLFKRFSYFGFYKLSKSKFFKFNKN